MDVIWDWIAKTGGDLNPFVVVLQAVIWVALGSGCCWGWLRRRYVSEKAQIAKLEKDVTYWKREYGEKETALSDANAERDDAVARLPEMALEKADAELREGNDELAHRELMA